jgi:hypothetical protein
MALAQSRQTALTEPWQAVVGQSGADGAGGTPLIRSRGGDGARVVGAGAGVAMTFTLPAAGS